jgi:hypothetical protein
MRAIFSVAILWSSVSLGAAQDFYHPLPWRAQAACVQAPSTMTRAQIDEALVAINRGEAAATALELIAPCAVPRRQVAEAFNHGGLERHRAADYTASARLFFGAVQADPSFLAARYNLACAYARAGDLRAAESEIGELARAGADARRWLRRVDTDPDLAPIRDDEDVRSYVSGRVTLWQPDPRPVPSFGAPPPSGAVWEPIEARLWPQLRDFIIASGRFQDRRGYQRAERLTATHADVAGLEPFAEASWWRPEPGIVFLVIPFNLPGPNHRDGIAVFVWTGGEYIPACHEYCAEMGDARHRQAFFRASSGNEVRILSCRDSSTTCALRLIQARGQSVYFRQGHLLDVTLTAPE